LSRIVLVVFVTLLLIAFEWRIRRDTKKSVIATAVTAYLLCAFFVGMTMRPIPPLFFAHIFSLVSAWVALMYYLHRGRLYLSVILSPLLISLVFVAMSFFSGARYEP